MRETKEWLKKKKQLGHLWILAVSYNKQQINSIEQNIYLEEECQK